VSGLDHYHAKLYNALTAARADFATTQDALGKALNERDQARADLAKNAEVYEREIIRLHDSIANFGTECDRLTADLAAARALLREAEWEVSNYFEGSFGPSCFYCERGRSEGHKPDCRLAALLKETTT